MNEAKKLKKTNPSKAQAGPDEEIDELIMKNIAKKKEREKRRCNLCGREFKARTRFMRFCDVCKGRSEVYRFAGTFS
ncbi:MAG: hypothetical protein D6812_16690 [Deltaproteobacteria bacterium]|nr:MAG: hypothetical protein D6812_16690 [Deltaproteobacteria bacterium]